MRAVAATLLGVLLATPVAAQTNQPGQSPNLGQQLLNGLTGSKDQNSRDAYEQGRQDQQRRQQYNAQRYNGENNRGDYRSSRSYDDRSNYGDRDRSDRRDPRYDPAYGDRDRSDRGPNEPYGTR